jgi:hypothetical protein
MFFGAETRKRPGLHIVDSPYFGMERWQLQAPYETTTAPGTFENLTAIDGAAGLT